MSYLCPVAIVDEGCRVKYDDQRNCFELLTPAGQLFKFELTGGLYVCNFIKRQQAIIQGRYPKPLTFVANTTLSLTESDSDSDTEDNSWHHEHVAVQTAADNERLFTRREVHKARGAIELKRKLGFPSDRDLAELASTGKNLDITPQDVARAHRIYGPNPHVLRGKTKTPRSTPIKIEHIPRSLQAEQVLHVDLFFIDKLTFVLAVADPLSLTGITHIPSKSIPAVHKALLDTLRQLRKAGFTVGAIVTDREGAVLALREELEDRGIRVNATSAGQHVPVAENKIRQVEERGRCVLSSLPFKLPRPLIRWLIAFCTQRLNMVQRRTRADAAIPMELFLGRKINFSRDVSIGFGDFVHVIEPIDNPITKASVADGHWPS